MIIYYLLLLIIDFSFTSSESIIEVSSVHGELEPVGMVYNEDSLWFVVNSKRAILINDYYTKLDGDLFVVVNCDDSNNCKYIEKLGSCKGMVKIDEEIYILGYYNTDKKKNVPFYATLENSEIQKENLTSGECTAVIRKDGKIIPIFKKPELESIFFSTAPGGSDYVLEIRNSVLETKLLRVGDESVWFKFQSNEKIKIEENTEFDNEVVCEIIITGEKGWSVMNCKPIESSLYTLANKEFYNVRDEVITIANSSHKYIYVDKINLNPWTTLNGETTPKTPAPTTAPTAPTETPTAPTTEPTAPTAPTTEPTVPTTEPTVPTVPTTEPTTPTAPITIPKAPITIPKAPTTTLTDSDDTPTDSDDTPTDSDDTPTDSDDTPTDSDNTPTDSDNTPTDSDDTPTDSDNTPTDSDNTPTDSDNTPTDSDDTPTDSDNTPTDSDNTPTDSDDTPADSDDTPTDSDDTPADSDDTPTDSDDTPTDSDDTPTDSDDIPTESEKTPVKKPKNNTKKAPNPAPSTDDPVEEVVSYDKVEDDSLNMWAVVGLLFLIIGGVVFIAWKYYQRHGLSSDGVKQLNLSSLLKSQTKKNQIPEDEEAERNFYA
jgi:hypothetical protein